MRHFLLYLGAIALFMTAYGCSEGTGSSSGPTLKTPGGYPYNFVVDKDGPVIQPGQYAYFHYTRRVDDSIMDSSRSVGQEPKIKLPTAEELAAQPNPLIEGLSFMSPGDSLRVSISLDSIPNIPPDLKSYSFLHMDIVLESIKSEEEYQADVAKEQAEQAAKAAVLKEQLPAVEKLVATTINDYKAGKIKNIQTTASGLKYLIHEEGTGAMTQKGERLDVMYYGSLTDGTRFDDSFSRGAPFQLALGQGMVIRGWDEGLALLKHGTKASFFIPAELGYGAQGSPPTIPPNAELHFYVEVL